jgi:hypothetical protein
MSTEEQEKKSASDEEEEDDDEDVEKLQAEILRMEAEANRIAKETEELENRKGGKQTATGGDSKGGTAASTTGNGETPNRDGCVVGMMAGMTRPHHCSSGAPTKRQLICACSISLI